MAATAKVHEVDHGMERELHALSAFKDQVACVGFFEGDKHEGAKGNEEADLVLIAAANEYGAHIENGFGKGIKIDIPERSFMRSWAIVKQDQTSRLMENLAKKVQDHAMSAATALKMLAAYGVDGIKKQVAAPEGVTFAPNADSTIKKKGSSHPLIDTGVLRDSVRSEVRKVE